MVFYGSLFFLGSMRGGPFDQSFSRLAQGNLTSLVQAIETYKLQNGRYPENLETLRRSLPETSLVFTFDPSSSRRFREHRPFHYELVDADHYYLLGVGQDDQPFTPDDILPDLQLQPGSKIDLLIRRT